MKHDMIFNGESVKIETLIDDIEQVGEGSDSTMIVKGRVKKGNQVLQTEIEGQFCSMQEARRNFHLRTRTQLF
jgi:hypothetical protein